MVSCITTELSIVNSNNKIITGDTLLCVHRKNLNDSRKFLCEHSPFAQDFFTHTVFPELVIWLQDS